MTKSNACECKKLSVKFLFHCHGEMKCALHFTLVKYLYNQANYISPLSSKHPALNKRKPKSLEI